MATEAQAVTLAKPWKKSGLRRGHYLTLLVAFAASVIVGYTAYQRLAVTTTPAAPIQMATAQRGSIAATVAATGNVVANRQSKLTFATSGTIREVMVNLGDKVKEGQPLAKIDTASQEIKLAQTRSQLRAAQIKLDDLKVGALPEELEAARASLASTQSKLSDLLSGPTDAEVKASEQSVIAAQSALSRAEADLSKLKAGPTQDEITVAKADLEKKQATLNKAQGDYDRVAWRGDVAARSEATALQQATIDYQASLASYNLKTAPPKAEDVSATEKNVESALASLASAQARLDLLKAGPKNADIQSGQSAVASAKSALALKAKPPEALDLAAQEEAVKQAELTARQAELDLAKGSLISPFAGTIAAVAMNAGEQTSGSSTITLVDPASVRIDVTVDESDLARLGLNKTAQVAFDALPDTRLPAKVVAIAPSASVQQGVVTYLVSLKLETGDVYLPPGMTANVSIVVDQKDGVVLVPNRAVRTQGRTRQVEVMVDGVPVTKQVTIGMSNDQMTEIVSGVQEGEQVVIRTTTTATPKPNVMGPMPVGAPGGGAIIMRK